MQASSGSLMLAMLVGRGCSEDVWQQREDQREAGGGKCSAVTFPTSLTAMTEF
jgi:hypothetical protein